jgi:hypothetical protein
MARQRTRLEIEADARRTGRPPKKAKDRQLHRITVYLTDAEMAHIEALAKEAGVSLAAMVLRPWREEKR